MGVETFLYERVFDDCLDRIALVPGRFERALLIGCPDAGWRARLAHAAQFIEVRDPGGLFADAARGETIVEDAWRGPARDFDLVLAIGTLDTVNDLPLALNLIRSAMRPGGLFIGAMSGGETLPQLRAAMRAADSVSGEASPHVHPRIEAAAVAPLLSQAGFVRPVIDVDRLQVGYASFAALVADLRRMGVTNILADRSRRPLSRAAYAAATAQFEGSADGARTTETFEILHFAAWTEEQG
jgi:SAM-dependent methyltransferase